MKRADGKFGIEIDPEAWKRGVVDGDAGRVWPPPPDCDSYSYCSGYIEGKAHRDGYEVAMTVHQTATEARAARAHAAPRQ
jgi:hypothetical protein